MTTSGIDTLHVSVPAISIRSVTQPLAHADAADIQVVADLLALIDNCPGQIEVTFTEDTGPLRDDLVQLARLAQRIRIKQRSTAGIDLRLRDGVMVMRIEAI